MRGKRRAFQQAERDKEMREAVMQARRTATKSGAACRWQFYSEPVAAAPEVDMPHPAVIAAITAEKQPGFLTRVFSRIFG